MSNRRRPLSPGLAYGAPMTKFWGRSYQGPPVVATGSLAQQAGTNAALARFFEMMLTNRYQQIEFNREQKAMYRNDMRDQRLSIERYGLQHENSMDESAFRDSLSAPGSAGAAAQDWRNNPLFNQNYHASGDHPNGMADFIGAGVIAGNNTQPAAPEKPDSSNDDGGLFGFIKTVGHIADKALGPVDEAAGDSLMWTLDKISRPVYAVSSGMKYGFAQDKDKNTFNPAHSWGDFAGGGFLSMISGKNIFDTADEIAADPVHFATGFYKAMYDGFVKKDGPTLYQDVVAQNAKMDPQHNIYDNHAAQAITGFMGDATLDPLNFVGAGLVKAPIKVGVRSVQSIQDAAKARKLMSLSQDLADAGTVAKDERIFSVGSDGVADIHPVTMDANRIYDMLGGNFPRPRSSAERLSQMSHVHSNIDTIMEGLNKAPVGTSNSSARASIEALGRDLSRQREAVLNEFAGETVLDGLRRKLGIKIAKGEESPDVLNELDDTLTAGRIAQVIPEARAVQRARTTALREVAKKYNIGATKDGRRTVRSETDNLMREYERLQGLRANNPAAAKKAQAMYKDIDKALNPEGRSLADILGDEVKHDLRFHDIDLEDVFKTSERYAFEDEHFKAQAGKSRAVDHQIKMKAGAIRAAEGRGEDTSVLQQQLNDLLNRKAHADRVKDRVQADIIIRILKKKLAEKYGAKVFTDPKFAKGVDKLLKHVQDELTGIKDGTHPNYQYTGITAMADDAHLPTDWVNADGTFQLHGSGPKSVEAPGVAGKPKVEKQPGEFKIDDETAPTGRAEQFSRGALDPHPGFYDRKSHLEHMERELKRQLKAVEGLQAPERKMLMNIPEHFLTDGKFNLGKLRAQIKYSRSRQLFTLEKTGNEATDAWLKDVEQVVQKHYDSEFNSLLDNAMKPINENIKQEMDRLIAQSKRGKNKAQRIMSETAAESAARKKFYPEINDARSKAGYEASQRAFRTVDKLVEHNNLAVAEYNSSLKLRAVGPHSTEEDLLKALEFKRGSDYATAWHKAQLEKVGAADSEIKRIDQALEDLRERHQIAAHTESLLLKQAKEGRKIMEKRLREDAILRIASMKLVSQRSKLAINILGTPVFTVPGSGSLFKAAEQLGGLPIIKETRQILADAFKSPVSRLPRELQLARNRAMNNTPEIIALHVRELMDKIGHIPESDRIASFDSWLKGTGAPTGDDVVQDSIANIFDDLVPYFRGEATVGGSKLTPDEINKYLPQEFKISERAINRGISTPQQLVRALREGKGVNKADRAELKDPYRISWTMRVAVEQAMARKGLEHTIVNTFGVKTGRIVNQAGHPVGKYLDDETVDVLDKLKGQGWKTIPELGNTHYFPPDIVPDIRRLMDMMEPMNIGKIGRVIDRATGYWKTAVTVYNPGYYTRNGVGEVMSAWLGGVHDPRHYADALKVMKFVRQEGRELQALKSHMPLLHLDAPTQSDNAKRIVATLKNGKKVTAEEAWVAYHDQGLKTGFFSTEFDAHYSRAGNAVRQSVAGKLSDAHQGMRNVGEDYEDYLRMAHFLHGLEHSGAGHLSAAAEHAAEQVRKYHFDYTDFTKFEKMVMLRAFPFYKWTRKAVPLMTTMMFMKPGKIMAYPKAMNSYSNAISTGDMQDDNGFAPNYEGIVPGWMQDMWAYKITEGQSDAPIDAGTGDDYFNLATPQMDALKAESMPYGTATTMLNPLFKVPLEEMAGHTLDPQMQLPLEGGPVDEDSLKHLLRQMPQTSMGVKAIDSSDKGNAWLSFLTGLGFYGNTKQRQQAEMSNY